ncbi:flagellin N-terminal helical domain-containing protein [Anaerocolumna jejuensis]|uniref:flagellin N-terminal helical domain-containing protein n=1 Tax=Anaerocolumna jejuensis TaxID=259063 RepID=UPI003F7BA36A
MVIQHNLQAMNTNRMLGKVTSSLSKSTEKLSSGYRINRAADDAAGLAISEKMRAQVLGLDRASANAQDGISLVQTAEGALSESQNILQRMRELSVQAANETNKDEDRENIQLEINQLTDELNRIGNTTEFNTKKLLQGNTTKATTSSSDITTLQKGVKTDTKGNVSKLLEKTESKKAKTSTAILTAGSAGTTGSATAITTKTEAEASAKASTKLLGLEFEAAGTGTAGNAYSIELSSLGEGSASAKDTADFTNGKLTINLSEETLNSITTVSDLNSKVGELLASAAKSSNNGTAGAITAITVKVPEGQDSSTDISSDLKALVSGTSSSEKANFSGGTAGKAGVYSFKLEDAFSETGDSITIAGYTFTAEAGAASAAADNDNTFRLGTDVAKINLSTQAKDIAAELQNKLGTGATVTSAADGTITIKEAAGSEGKLKLDSTVTTKGNGNDETLTIKDEFGQNLQVKLVQAGDDNLAVSYTAATGTDTTGTITIALAKTTASNNSADAIQTALRSMTDSGLATDGVDVSKISVTGNAGWIEGTTGASINTSWSTMTGGVKAQQGVYEFNLTTKMSAGETLTIGGETFTAVESDADASKGEFNVGTDIASQLNNIQNAFNSNAVLKKYDMAIDGSKVTLTEQTASGKNLAAKGVSVSANDTMGSYSVDVANLLTDGASITIDGEQIKVSSKNEHVGYDNGTAIKEAKTVAEQIKKLTDAINTNKALSEKYTASVGDDGKLVLTQKNASAKGPEVSTTSSTKGNFELKLQIGANAGQSMTIEIGDNRALALGISGDGSSTTVKAGDGNVASYTTVANVNNGSDKDNIEFALDISSSDKASAATSVIGDALNNISKQRAVLGAAQNRLEHTISNLDNTSENLSSAESAIRDTDMAKEMVSYSKNNILSQAAQSMLAQANQSNQGVLSLLK